MASSRTGPGPARTRLSQLQRHVHVSPLAHTADFSTERVAIGDMPSGDAAINNNHLLRSQHKSNNLKDINSSVKMSSQAAHSTLLIPGPIEFDDAVLQSMGHYA